MTQLMFRCPHCHEREAVTREAVGQVTECSACGQPYQPEMPVGRLMRQNVDGDWLMANTAVSGRRSSDEKTVMTVHPAMFRAHPLKYVGLVLTIVVGLVGIFYFGAHAEDSAVGKWWRPVTLGLGIVCGIAAVVSLISLIYWFVRTRYDSLTISNERTTWARGILDRETSEVQHDDVRNIQIKQTFLDRILGVGRIAISSAGQDEMEIDVRDVPNPSEVADTVRSCQSRMQGRTT